MARDSIDLLELLHKRGVDGDVDFLREALRVLTDALMDAEVTARIGAECGERSPDRFDVPQRLPLPPVGHQGRHDGTAHTEAERGELLPEPA